MALVFGLISLAYLFGGLRLAYYVGGRETSRWLLVLWSLGFSERKGRGWLFTLWVILGAILIVGAGVLHSFSVRSFEGFSSRADGG
jgi:hypothetical protein